MNKFDLIYNSLLQQTNKNIILQAEGGTDIQQPAQQSTQQASSKSFDWISNLILPTLLGAGSASMLFGKGLFGLGKSNKFFGGWGGQTLGALGLIAAVPQLWSDKSFSERFGAVFSNISNGDWGNAIKELLGISTSADQVLNNGQQQADNLASNAAEIEKRKNKYINTANSGEKIFKWLQRNNYNPSKFTIINDDIACFLITPQYSSEKERYPDDTKTLGVVVSTNKGAQAAICSTQQIVSLINQSFAGMLRLAFIKGDQQGKIEGNPKLKQTCQAGLNNLKVLGNSNIPAKTLLDSINYFKNGLSSLNAKSLNYITELFGGMTQAVQVGLLLQLPTDQDILKEQDATTVDDIAKDFANDEQSKNLKEDPVLNKFDSDLQKIEHKLTDIRMQTLVNSIQAANEKDPTAYIIQGRYGNKKVYYARKPQNNYLTDDIKETVYFNKSEVEKLEGSGDPALKLQNTLQKINMPQIMKMKNSGLKLYIVPINIQYAKKVSEILKQKFNFTL